MKLTNEAIYNLLTAIEKFNNVKGKTAFVLFRAFRKLQDEIKDCDEQKNNLLQKYGKEENGVVSVSRDDEEAYTAFMKEFVPILRYELEVDIPQFTEEEFDTLREVDSQATMNDYYTLYTYMVKHSSPEPPVEKVEAEIVE